MDSRFQVPTNNSNLTNFALFRHEVSSLDLAPKPKRSWAQAFGLQTSSTLGEKGKTPDSSDREEWETPTAVIGRRGIRPTAITCPTRGRRPKAVIARRWWRRPTAVIGRRRRRRSDSSDMEVETSDNSYVEEGEIRWAAAHATHALADVFVKAESLLRSEWGLTTEAKKKRAEPGGTSDSRDWEGETSDSSNWEEGEMSDSSDMEEVQEMSDSSDREEGEKSDSSDREEGETFGSNDVEERVFYYESLLFRPFLLPSLFPSSSSFLWSFAWHTALSAPLYIYPARPTFRLPIVFIYIFILHQEGTSDSNDGEEEETSDDSGGEITDDNILNNRANEDGDNDGEDDKCSGCVEKERSDSSDREEEKSDSSDENQVALWLPLERWPHGSVRQGFPPCEQAMNQRRTVTAPPLPFRLLVGGGGGFSWFRVPTFEP
ncbi:hypothetical protein QBC40DRAFT_300551 [Triangularia verruculosa]|uniref:Uncharacterized protein n=1 Tax=Triangularia verruculosa TaxID=2587418 RepID=A0AAN6X9W8_9PEZI|nr:hypothetical protein QBC40DRAFT_300551 [Triangularia verruculosa]